MEMMKCPFCGSDKMVKHGHGTTAGFKVAQRWQCKECKRSTTRPIKEGR